MSNNNKEYVYGLDIFRSAAIIFVLIGHTFEHSSLPSWLANVGHMGGMGVEMFFVLSGFLIGAILIRLIDAGRLQNMTDVVDFWRRRWLRTLPLYFVITFVFLRFDYHGRHGLLDYPLYFVFMQNFAWKIPEFFELSWSLAVEEHFYLWFPLVFLIFLRLVKGRLLSLILSASVFILIAYAYRLRFPLITDWNEFNRILRLSVLSRLDAVMFGVLMAALKRYVRPVFDTVYVLTPLSALVFVLICCWYYIGVPGILSSRAVQVNLCTFQSLVCCMLLPWFDAMKEKPKTGLGDFYILTSRLSYSLYMVHILVIIGVNHTLSKLGLYDRVYPQALAIFTIYFSLYYVTAWVTYSLIERPFLQLREQAFSWRMWAEKTSPALATFVFLALAV